MPPALYQGNYLVPLGYNIPYNADTLARFLGGVYIKTSGRAQNSVLAALGILAEMEGTKGSWFF